MEKSERRTPRQVTDDLLAAQRAERAAQVRQLDLIVELLGHYDTAPQSALTGAARLVPSGADGTPLIDEFLAHELGPLLQVTPAHAWSLIQDAANLKTRHPHTWAAVHAGHLPVWQARQIARSCADLQLTDAHAVDAKMAPAYGRLPWPRLRRKLAGHIVTADSDLAAAKAERARRERYVSFRHGQHGASWIVGQLDTAAALRLQDAIHTIARSIMGDAGYSGTPGEAMADALESLATPQPAGKHAGLPPGRATLVVHLAAESVQQGNGVARVTGAWSRDEIGPVLTKHLRHLLAHHHIRVLPVIDLADNPAVDSYEIPTQVRRHVALRNQHSVFPFHDAPARSCDLDHTTPFTAGHPGQTRASNLGVLDRTSHRAKTHGGWQLVQPAPGVFHWTSPLGYRYEVDASGSRRLPTAPTRASVRASYLSPVIRR